MDRYVKSLKSDVPSLLEHSMYRPGCADSRCLVNNRHSSRAGKGGQPW